MDSPSPADILDMFAELPRRVQVAVMSLARQLHERPRLGVCFHEYPQHVAAYIQASGLLEVRLLQIGNEPGARFWANDLTILLYENRRKVLEIRAPLTEGISIGFERGN